MTVVVAVLFFRLGAVTCVTAKRVIYLDAILYLMGGILGTAHHWYFTGQSSMTMAIGATFSALEVVPLYLLTLDAWDFIRSAKAMSSRGQAYYHSASMDFLLPDGGRFLELPRRGRVRLSDQHADRELLRGRHHPHAQPWPRVVYGRVRVLGVALLVFTSREVVNEATWARIEKYVRLSFWGLNLGLASMIMFNLFPGGVMQLYDVLQNGYWHARSHEYLGTAPARFDRMGAASGRLGVHLFGGDAANLDHGKYVSFATRRACRDER